MLLNVFYSLINLLRLRRNILRAKKMRNVQWSKFFFSDFIIFFLDRIGTKTTRDLSCNDTCGLAVKYKCHGLQIYINVFETGRKKEGLGLDSLSNGRRFRTWF